MARALRIVPALCGLSVIRAFAGLRPHSDSGAPIIGRVDGPEGLIIAAGHGGDGVALAPVTGQLVASLALAPQVATLSESADGGARKTGYR